VPVDNTRQLPGFRKGVIVDGLAFQSPTLSHGVLGNTQAVCIKAYLTREGGGHHSPHWQKLPGEIARKESEKGEAGATMDVAIVA